MSPNPKNNMAMLTGKGIAYSALEVDSQAWGVSKSRRDHA